MLTQSFKSLQKHWIAFLATVLVVNVLMAGCGLTTNTATSTSSSDVQQQVINAINKVQPSVVEIQGSSAQAKGLGSGNILTRDGYILTNDHVVRNFDQFQVRLGENHIVPAQLIGEAPAEDLAVLKVNQKNLIPITAADSDKAQVGQFVVALGNPLGLAETATIGIVSALNRTATEAPEGPASQLTALIQTSAPINPGNSGGALVDLEGRLLGIPTLAAVDPTIGVPANGIGFAIPANKAKTVAQQLIQKSQK